MRFSPKKLKKYLSAVTRIGMFNKDCHWHYQAFGIVYCTKVVVFSKKKARKLS